MTEIDINIEGYNENGICLGCLNYNRKMFRADEVKECFRLLANIEVPEGRTVQVCWECLAVIRTFSRFRTQVVKAFAVLKDYSRKHRYLESPSALTKYATTHLSCHVVSITSTQWSANQAGGAGESLKTAENGPSMEEDQLRMKEDQPRMEEDQPRMEDDQHAVSEVARPSHDEIKVEIEDSELYADPLAGFESDDEATVAQEWDEEPAPAHAQSDSEDEVVRLVRRLRRRGRRPKAPTLQAKNAPTDSSLDLLKQITNKKELEEMERRLADDEYKRHLIKSCSMLCSRSVGSGTNCAYRFCDVLFSRKFLCDCSWTGGARRQEEKIGLKFHPRVLQLFFEMVRQWDPSYTMEDNEAFLRTLVRNAKKRSESKYMRKSSTRKRSKNATDASRDASGDVRVSAHADPPAGFESDDECVNDPAQELDRRRSDDSAIGSDRQLPMTTLPQAPTFWERNTSTDSSLDLLKQITNKTELEEFEKRLTDEVYMRHLIKSCSMLCSRSVGSGTNCAYRFSDVLFSRKFLCECSWSGEVRGESQKIGLKFYQRVVRFYFEMVRQWDPSYTMEDNEAFLRIIVKNATTRYKAKNLRQSSKRKYVSRRKTEVK